MTTADRAPAWDLPEGPYLPVDYEQAVALLRGRGYTHMLTAAGPVPLAQWTPFGAPARWHGCLIPAMPDRLGDLPDVSLRHVWPAQISADTIVAVWQALRLPPTPADQMRAALADVHTNPYTEEGLDDDHPPETE
jgi:hypothetical protein